MSSDLKRSAIFRNCRFWLPACIYRSGDSHLGKSFIDSFKTPRAWKKVLYPGTGKVRTGTRCSCPQLPVSACNLHLPIGNLRFLKILSDAPGIATTIGNCVSSQSTCVSTWSGALLPAPTREVSQPASPVQVTHIPYRTPSHGTVTAFGQHTSSDDPWTILNGV